MRPKAIAAHSEVSFFTFRPYIVQRAVQLLLRHTKIRLLQGNLYSFSFGVPNYCDPESIRRPFKVMFAVVQPPRIDAHVIFMLADVPAFGSRPQRIAAFR